MTSSTTANWSACSPGWRTATRSGRVISVLHLPFQDVLEIQTPTGVRLVPFVEALVPEVDLAAGSLTVADVEGLLSDQDGA